MRISRWVMLAIPALATVGSLTLYAGQGERPEPGVKAAEAQQMRMGGMGHEGRKHMEMSSAAQDKMGHGQMPMGQMDGAQGPIHITREQLHESGGVPPGWYFRLPVGDVEAGREVFIAMKCFTCHGVEGEKFPAYKRDVGDVGPDLTGMGPMHPPEYLAEAVLHPSAVVITGDGFAGPDGLSKMPDYLDTLSLGEWVDLTAYLRSLKPKAGTSHGGGGMHKEVSRVHPAPR
ncbi:MAG: c-type cytochrome [Candidatus Methylomirabilia bacterium]